MNMWMKSSHLTKFVKKLQRCASGVLEWKMMPPPTGHPSRRNLGSYSRNMWKPWCSLISPFQPFDVQRGPTSPVCPPFEEAFLQLGTAPSTDFSTGVSWWTWSETPKFTYQWLGFWEYVFFSRKPLVFVGRWPGRQLRSRFQGWIYHLRQQKHRRRHKWLLRTTGIVCMYMYMYIYIYTYIYIYIYIYINGHPPWNISSVWRHVWRSVLGGWPYIYTYMCTLHPGMGVLIKHHPTSED